jgi:hypothetical protein
LLRIGAAGALLLLFLATVTGCGANSASAYDLPARQSSGLLQTTVGPVLGAVTQPIAGLLPSSGKWYADQD